MAENPLHGGGGDDGVQLPKVVVSAQPGAIDTGDVEGGVAPLRHLSSDGEARGDGPPRASVSLDHFEHDQLGSGLYHKISDCFPPDRSWSRPGRDLAPKTVQACIFIDLGSFFGCFFMIFELFLNNIR